MTGSDGPSSAAASYLAAPLDRPALREQLTARLHDAIRVGYLRPGSRLPGERELATTLRISRPTVRLALDDLERSGSIVRRQGRGQGTRVADDPPLTATTDAPDTVSPWWRQALLQAAAEAAALRRGPVEPLDAALETVRSADPRRPPAARAAAGLRVAVAAASDVRHLLDATVAAESVALDTLLRTPPRRYVGRTFVADAERLVDAIRHGSPQEARDAAVRCAHAASRVTGLAVR